MFPAPRTYHARATRTHVLCKGRFRTGRVAMAVDQNGDFHRDALFDSVKNKFLRVRDVFSSSQERGNAREILNATPAMVLHGIERAVGDGEEFLRRIAILRESRNSGAHRKRRVLRLSGETLADSSDHARGDVFSGFRQYQSKFVAAVSRGGVNCAGMIAQNLADAHQRAAAREMPVLIVDDLATIHVEKYDAEEALRAPRAVNLGLKTADESAVIRQSGERVGNRHRAYLLAKARLVQQSAGKHDDVAERLGQLREKKGAVKKLP